MLSKRKIKNTFPLDFYGEDGSWRFIIRAENPGEVLDAMYWRAYISCHRKEFDLLHVATDKFNYKYNYSSVDAADLHYGTADADQYDGANCPDFRNIGASYSEKFTER